MPMKKRTKKPARTYKDPNILGRSPVTGMLVRKPAVKISAARAKRIREAVQAVVSGK
ncbi:MAG: hypothetical protein JSR81_13625 [Proteobacteria bacterium]|nr:hypothetical protein [Pseudomonadota bacterium]